MDKNVAVESSAKTIDFGSQPLDSILQELDCTEETLGSGLSSKDAGIRLEMFGPNALESTAPKSILRLILEQFDDRLAQILLIIAVISGAFSFYEMTEEESLLEAFVEPLIIVAILIINAAVGVWQSKSAQGSLEALKRMQPALATVMRDGVWLDGINAASLVPGDIISMRVGDKVPSDARLISLQTSSFSVDESSLTGESDTVQKVPGFLAKEHAPVQDQQGLVYSGTMVTSGSGVGMVVRTGMTTEMGKIQQGVTEAQQHNPLKTPLSIKLDEFGEILTSIIGVICAAVFFLSIPKFSDPSFNNIWEGAIYYAKVAVALGVAAIPEGLPAVITLCLSLGTKRMAKRNVIVRKLPCVETLGCTGVICTDKTGTLTTNEMTAVSLVVLEDNLVTEHKITGLSYSPLGEVSGIPPDELSSLPNGAFADVFSVSALCNDAKIIGNDGDHAQYERVGEPTEAALCILAEKLAGVDRAANVPPSVLANFHVSATRNQYPRHATLEFNRDRKSMSALCETPIGNRLYVKGAPNLLLRRCTHVKRRDGTVMPLTAELRKLFEEKTSELATRPLRCLALAVKENVDLEESLKNYHPENDDVASSHPLLSDSSNFISIESGLTLVGIVGIKDPARPEVADSITQCSNAGIRVIMITGDAKDTAVAIAKEVNIFAPSKSFKAFEGREFFEKSKEEQRSLLQTDNLVFCRTEPADKQKLIKMLQEPPLSEISAMTGDGVNDAPALQQAAIGISMGTTGTEVAKEASDLILVDDNFATIVSAVEEGRCIYSNMQAFICFLISGNIGEIWAILLATIAGFPEPLTAMHLLWVNLVTDGPPATALSFNPPDPDVMQKMPRLSDEPILNGWLFTRYCLTGLYVGLAAVGIFVNYYLDYGIKLGQLASWSKCGELWQPPSESLLCSDLFKKSTIKLPQTLSLTTLVCMELLKALSAVSLDNSILIMGPQKNPSLILGVTVAFLLHLAVIYSAKLGIPALGESFGVVPLTLEHWKTVFKFAAPVLLVEEILKTIGRRVNKDKEEERTAALEALKS